MISPLMALKNFLLYARLVQPILTLFIQNREFIKGNQTQNLKRSLYYDPLLYILI